MNLSLSQRHTHEYFTSKQMFIYCLHNISTILSCNSINHQMLYLQKATNNYLNSENNAHVIDISPWLWPVETPSWRSKFQNLCRTTIKWNKFVNCNINKNHIFPSLPSARHHHNGLLDTCTLQGKTLFECTCNTLQSSLALISSVFYLEMRHWCKFSAHNNTSSIDNR